MRTGTRVLAMVAIAVGLLVGVPSVASAQVYVGVTPPELGGVDVRVLGTQFRPVQPAPTGQLTVLSAGGARAVQQPARVGGLAVTGGDIIGLLVLAMAAVALGSVAVRAGRRADVSS